MLLVACMHRATMTGAATRCRSWTRGVRPNRSASVWHARC